MTSRALRLQAVACLLAAFGLGVLIAHAVAPRADVRFVPDLSGLVALAHDGEYVERSRRLIDEQRYADAVALCDRGLALWPGNVSLQLNRAVAQLLLGHVGEGRDALAAVVAQDPSNTLARNNLRWADELRGASEARLTDLTHRLALAADAAARVALLRERAQVQADLGDSENALSDYDAILRTAPADAAALNNAGVVLMQAARYDEAEARFRAAAAHAPQEALYT